MDATLELAEVPREGLIAIILAQRERLVQLEGEVAELTTQVEALRGEVEDLRAAPPAGPGGPPSWVKPNRPKGPEPKPGRKKREHGFSRRRDVPTEQVFHAVEACPECQCRLLGGWVKYRRQVLDVPVTPVRVIEHVVLQRDCPQCGRAYVPQVDLSAEVLGQQRVSLGTMSLIASLRTVGRLPIRTVQWVLETFHGLHLSVGAIVEVLHTVAACGQPTLAALVKELRASPVVHGDETGWREAGQNGYAWTFTTPTVRYFLYRPSRSGELVTEVLGQDFGGVLVSDCYGGYNRHAGQHQRCWVHLLRDLHALTRASPEDADLQAWATGVKQLYARAKETAARTDLAGPAREAAQHAYEAELAKLGEPYLRSPTAPPRVLCERFERFLPEWFVFVADPRVPSENNAAERSLRPLVIGRKISGGTQSDVGSQTRMALASLFGTWLARGLNPYVACRALLTSPSV